MQKNHLTSIIVTFWDSKRRRFSTGRVVSKNLNAQTVKVKEDVSEYIHELDRRDIIPGTGRPPQQYLKMLECLWADFEDKYWREYNYPT